MLKEDMIIYQMNRELEIMSPYKEPFNITISDIYDANGNVLESENHPKSKAYFKSETKLKPFDFVRQDTQKALGVKPSAILIIYNNYSDN